jgi:hypothetical protein
VAYDNNKPFDEKRNTESIFSKRIKAGKRRTYFFDVRETRGSDYFITITESKKRFNDDGYDRHKMFIYKEDFNKFLAALTETVDYVKTDLMPDFDFDAFNHDENEEGREYSAEPATYSTEPTAMVAETETVSQITDSEPITAADDDSGMDAWKI